MPHRKSTIEKEKKHKETGFFTVEATEEKALKGGRNLAPRNKSKGGMEPFSADRQLQFNAGRYERMAGPVFGRSCQL